MAARITWTLYGFKMAKNPYQSPNGMPDQIGESEHRSFRLTPSSNATDDSLVVGSARSAVKFALVLQVPLLCLAALILDGGLIFRRFVIASIAFWILVLIIRIRRGSEIPDSDILLIKWGYLPILLITCIFWLAGSVLMP